MQNSIQNIIQQSSFRSCLSLNILMMAWQECYRLAKKRSCEPEDSVASLRVSLRRFHYRLHVLYYYYYYHYYYYCCYYYCVFT